MGYENFKSAQRRNARNIPARAQVGGTQKNFKRGLHQMLNRVPDVHSKNARGKDARSAGCEAYVWIDFNYFSEYFGLFFLLVIARRIQKELVFLVPGNCASIRQKHQHDRCNSGPYDP